MKNTQKTVRLGVIGLVMACSLNSNGAEYAGWTVGATSIGGQAILRSTDSGVSWTRQGIGQVADVSMFGVDAVDANTAWVVGLSDSTGATIYHTTDGGLNWNRMLSAAQVSSADLQKVTTFGDRSVWAVGPGVILHSGDSGTTWTNQLPSGYDGIQFQGISTPDGVNVWATGNATNGYATILKSSDGGLHWARQIGGDVPLLAQILDISSVNANTAWAIGSHLDGGSLAWKVVATTDGGVTWTEKNQGTGDGNGICAVDASTIWVVTDNNTLWSINGGATWSETNSQTDTMGISAIDSQKAWAVSAALSGAIQGTTNGGNTWVKQTQLDGEAMPSLFTVSFAPTPVPEPSNAALLAVSAIGLVFVRLGVRNGANLRENKLVFVAQPPPAVFALGTQARAPVPHWLNPL